MKRNVLCAFMLVVLLACTWCGSAFALALHGKGISTIPELVL